MTTYKEIRRDVLLVCWICLVMQLFWLVFPISKDDTDPPHGRSGMTLRVDHGTGLHYLESSEGHLIPRLGSDGLQIRSSRPSRQSGQPSEQASQGPQ